MSTLGQGIEAECLTAAKNATYNSVGTAGSTVYDTDTMLSAREKLKKNLVPAGDLYALLDSTAIRSAVNARKGLFQDTSEISKMYKSGAMGRSDGFIFLENNLLPTHTNGNDVVFEVRTTVSTEGQATLVVEALTTTTGTVKKGTTFTIANVYGVHPQTKATLTTLQQFVVTADATADATAAAAATADAAYAADATAAAADATAATAAAAAATAAAATAATTAATADATAAAYRQSIWQWVENQIKTE